MFPRKTALKFGAAAIALLLAGCASSSVVKSNKLAGYNGEVKRMFVEASLGTALLNKASGDETAVFTSTMNNVLNSCGTQIQIHLKDPLDLNDKPGELIKQFGPDSILQITWQNERTGTNVPTTTVYGLSLFDVKAKKIVWKAQVEFTSRWSAGTVLASSILDKMKQDGLIDASCVIPVVK